MWWCREAPQYGIGVHTLKADRDHGFGGVLGALGVKNRKKVKFVEMKLGRYTFFLLFDSLVQKQKQKRQRKKNIHQLSHVRDKCLDLGLSERCFFFLFFFCHWHSFQQFDRTSCILNSFFWRRRSNCNSGRGSFLTCLDTRRKCMEFRKE